MLFFMSCYFSLFFHSFFFFNDTATTEIYTLSLRRSSDLYMEFKLKHNKGI